MYYKKNVDFVELLWEDFVFQIDNIDTKKQEKMYYPRFTKAEEHEPSKKVVSSQKPSRKQSASVVFRDTLGVTASKKKTPTKTDKSKGDSSDGTGSKPGVLYEPKGKSIDTNKGTSLKLGVPDVSKGDSSESKTYSENQETNDDEEESDDEFLHTPPNYALTDDEKMMNLMMLIKKSMIGLTNSYMVMLTPNEKLIYNSIINGPYVRRMILEPGDPNREVPMNETFHVQTDDELTEKKLKQIDANDQAIQTILLGLPEDIYAAVDSCKTAQEIWLRVQQMMKGSDIGIQEKKAKLFNEWEMFTSNDEELIESYYHRLLKLMNDLKRNKHFLEKIASNLKFLNNLQPEWSRHVIIVHQTKDLHIADYTQLYDFLKYNQKEVDDLKAERLTRTQDPIALMATSNNPYTFPELHQDHPSFNQNYMQQPMLNPEDIIDPINTRNIALALMAKAFKINYSTPINNNQRISSNPHNRQIAQPGMNMGQDKQMHMFGGNSGNQFRQYAGQNVGNLNGYNDVQNVRNQNSNGNGNLAVARAEGNAIGHNGNQIRCYNCKGVADLDEIEEVNGNCILMANLQQASTSGTQTDKDLVYDSDGSAEKMALGYQNPFYLKQAQQKQQSLYDGNVLLEKHDPPVVHDYSRKSFKNETIEQRNKTSKLYKD
nr:hypothetical protein [Tanacetum cinerariifolium]